MCEREARHQAPRVEQLMVPHAKSRTNGLMRQSRNKEQAYLWGAATRAFFWISFCPSLCSRSSVTWQCDCCDALS